jgi:hypothetical protein
MQTVGASKKWVGLAVVACGACCAVPLAAVFGIGGAMTATGALFAGLDTETVLCLGVLGALLVGGGYLWLRARRRTAAAQSCSASCSTDASCCGGKSNPSGN